MISLVIVLVTHHLLEIIHVPHRMYRHEGDMKFIVCGKCGGWTGVVKVSAKLQRICPTKPAKPYDLAQLLSGHKLVNGKKVYRGDAIPFNEE